MLQHFASSRHAKKVRKFLRDHGASQREQALLVLDRAQIEDVASLQPQKLLTAQPSRKTEATAEPATIEQSERVAKRRRAEDKDRNPNRLGKDIDRSKISIGGDWLPNFGTVWEAGPRSQTRKNFKRRLRT